jgi:hypothetical protein
MSVNRHKNQQTFSIPNELANSFERGIQKKDTSDSFTRPTDRNPVYQQLNEQIRRDDDIRADEEIISQPHVQRIPHNAVDKRERFIMGLYDKHKGLPNPYHSITRRQRIHRPEKAGVRREILHPDSSHLGNQFQNLANGDDEMDKVRRHFNTPNPRIFDGRITAGGVELDTSATGAIVMPKQSVFEANLMRKIGRKAIKREVEALNDMRNIHALSGRVVASSWQGPNAIDHDFAESTKIRKRKFASDIPFYSAPEGSVYHRPYARPDNITARPVQQRVVPGRVEITGAVTKAERPRIDSFIQKKNRPRVHEFRTPNPTDISTFTGSSEIQKNDGFKTSARPNFINPSQRTNWVVNDNRASRQAHQDNDQNFETVAMRQDAYSSKLDQGRQGQEAYQRGMDYSGILNKIPLFSEPERLLTHRDPLLAHARYVDMNIL